MPQRDRLPRVERDALLGKSSRRPMSKRQVHVVAADKQVISDRQATEHQFAVFFCDGDQREIGGAAADVAHQQRVAELEHAPPAVSGVVEPGIDGGLWLFKQHQILRQSGC